MDIEKLVLDANGFFDFNPMQAKVLKKKLFEKSLVVSAPTASGKTIIAELAGIHSIIKEKKKVVYTCPLRALASEHFSDFKRKYSAAQNIKFALGIGDYDSGSTYLKNFDFILSTYEKLDSLIRHRAEWLAGIGLLIIDEIHELDSNRGPTIEVTIAKLKQINPKLKILALSATIPNAGEVAEWLDAELVESDYRPVKLKEGVFFNSELFYPNSSEPLHDSDPLLALAKDTLLAKKKQALVFASTRKRAESIATSIAPVVNENLSAKEKNALSLLSEKILHALEVPTEQCRKLSNLVSQGSVFHHAGLLHKQRALIEDAFRENKIKIISATPTLAAGVNLPSHTVIIPSLYRYESIGMARIPVREYKQLAGRAGRPKFDSEGRSIVIARSDSEKDDVIENYVLGEMENITSQLGIKPVLRMHLLSLVASNFVFDLHSMEEFFSKTFYAKQFGEMHDLLTVLQECVSELLEMGFVQGSDTAFRATKIGQRVSELYLDPLSAFTIIQGLKLKRKYSDFFYLFLLSNTSEFAPWQNVPKKKEPELWEETSLRGREMPIDLEKEQFFDSDLLKKFNSSLMLESWVNEKPEQSLLEDFGVQPGILRSKLTICDWLAYSSLELAKLLELQEHFSFLSKIRKRIKSGIKEDLINLCEVRGIGRVRARRLWRANIKTVAALKKTDARDLGKILGEKIAVNIKQSIGQKS